MGNSNDLRHARLHPGHVIAWSLLPMALAISGAWLDEHSRLGFTTWQSACRSVGISPRSLLVFTVELLPTAVIGALAGGLLVQLRGVLARGRCRAAQSALAAHGGCVLGMLAGLVFCALGLSWPIAVAAEALLAMGLAAWLFGRMPFPARASVLPRSQGPSSAY